MAPILQVGDAILTNKLSYGIRLPFATEPLLTYSIPQRGDIVTYALEDDATTAIDESTVNTIQRVIGLPGEKIEVTSISVFINGKRYNDSAYARWDGAGTKDFPPTTVPKDHVFLLGDNRNHSRDSRFFENPFVNVARIKGRVFVRYWDYRDGEKITYSKMRWDDIEPSKDRRGFVGE